MTKKEKTERCQYILYSYVGEVAYDDDVEFLYSIFEQHSEWEQKKGCGVDFFYVGKSQYNNLCFFIKRLDGTATDISFTSAITKPSKRSKVIKACRTAIEPDIEKFRKENIVYGETKCALSGQILIPQNTHIDHYELSFNDLFNKWIKNIDFDVAYSFVCETKDNECKTYFINQHIIDDFVWFHNTNTHLRAVTKDANLRRPRK